ncbi:hypothetical protein CYLTODRAFT_390655 [Cylindrobasidium torrendii FP15055 ss-10]|uniref:Zn(2)-C6 fungal-type domain-containing protein n=1 Tax=Cylindrobasidium torrendii FP15055 ss-10 TaxID=1314674 RepID=A0A0D7BNW7_9AGAR|nr:hypothetical protein CYLTODRAFT_390655 [Cylindrobasidium torrendii FP15055 ss-10]
MPAEPRRRQKVFSEEELKDLEEKRSRGEASCAECRRLKLRCDKSLPCSSCVRRGCESICPLGVLSAGQGTRFILADTDKLHRKIADMSTRIRQLEDALAIMHATQHSTRHPLLHDDLLKIKFGAEAPLEHRESSAPKPVEGRQESLDALGTLTLSDSGSTRYFGRSAGSETLMAADDGPHVEDGSDAVDAPPDNVAFPFAAPAAPTNVLSERLPPSDRVSYLAQSYVDHASLFFRPIKHTELFQDLLTADPQSLSGETLSMLFFVLALGALFDLKLPAYNDEAEVYYALGVSALGSRLVTETPKVDTIRAVGLMATYQTLASKKHSRDSAWTCMSLAAKLAQSIGLHRDSARWKMDAKVVELRRMLWWEVYSADISHSLAIGRPPAIHPSFADCEFPIDEEATLSHDGVIEYGFWRMKYTFAREIFMPIIDATLTASPPKYATVLELDKKARLMHFPSSIKPYARIEDGEAEYYSSARSLKDFYASSHRVVTMLYLHRSFFAQATLDNPENPLLSTYGPSFLISVRCASIIIKAAVHQFERCADIGKRTWILLYHVFSAAVVVGSVVTHCPSATIAPDAMNDLELAVKLFELSAEQSSKARTAFAVLVKLKEKATKAVLFKDYTSSIPRDTSTSMPILKPLESEDSDDEIAIFGGQKKLLVKGKGKRTANGMVDSPMSSNAPDSPSASSPTHGYQTKEAPSPLAGPSTGSRSHNSADSSLYDYTSIFAESSASNAGMLSQPYGGMGMPEDALLWPSHTHQQLQDPSSFTTDSTMYIPPVSLPGLMPAQGDHLIQPHTAGPRIPMRYTAPVELGLMTESNMDAGWDSFLRECGIVGDVGNGMEGLFE